MTRKLTQQLRWELGPCQVEVLLEHSRGAVLVNWCCTQLFQWHLCTTANRMIQSHTSLIKKGNIKGISRLEVPFNRHLQWIVSLSSWMILSFSIMKEDKHDSSNRRSRLPSVVKLSCCIQSHLCFKHLGASVKACDVEDMMV